MRHAATTIQRNVSELGTAYDFIGITNDEFIVLTHTDDVDTLDRIIQDTFAEEIKAFYTFMDVDQGGVLLNEGKSNETLVGLMQFSGTRDHLASATR